MRAACRWCRWLSLTFPHGVGVGALRTLLVLARPRIRKHQLAGLSGVGDTFGTCFGPLSRNRNLGIRIGKGEKLSEILGSTTEVAEGVDTAFALAELIRRSDRSFRIDLKYPIVFGVCQVRSSCPPGDGWGGCRETAQGGCEKQKCASVCGCLSVDLERRVDARGRT